MEKITSVLLLVITSLSVLPASVYAASNNCVEDHFEMLKYDYSGTDNDEIRTPPSENTCPYVAMSLLLFIELA